MGMDFVAWKAQAKANNHGFYRPKPIEADFFDAFDASHIQYTEKFQ